MLAEADDLLAFDLVMPCATASTLHQHIARQKAVSSCRASLAKRLGRPTMPRVRQCCPGIKAAVL